MAAAATLRPVGTEPVKDTAPTPGCVGEGRAGLAVPVHDLEEVGGDAGLDAGTRRTRSAHAGASSDGFITTPLPASRAGKIFQDGMATGKFHGVIIPTTPTGCRVVQAILSASSEGTRLPHRGPALPGDEAAMSMASCTSPPASMRTLPASRLTSSASSALRAASTSAAAAITSARAGTGTSAQARCASAAAATASSTSAAVESGSWRRPRPVGPG